MLHKVSGTQKSTEWESELMHANPLWIHTKSVANMFRPILLPLTTPPRFIPPLLILLRTHHVFTQISVCKLDPLPIPDWTLSSNVTDRASYSTLTSASRWVACGISWAHQIRGYPNPLYFTIIIRTFWIAIIDNAPYYLFNYFSTERAAFPHPNMLNEMTRIGYY